MGPQVASSGSRIAGSHRMSGSAARQSGNSVELPKFAMQTCELGVGRGNGLIAVVKAKEFQATRPRIRNIQHCVGGHLILHAKVPLLVIGSPQIGRDGIKFRSVGVQKARSRETRSPTCWSWGQCQGRQLGAIERYSPAGNVEGLAARFPHGDENHSEEKNGGLNPGLGLE